MEDNGRAQLGAAEVQRENGLWEDYQ